MNIRFVLLVALLLSAPVWNALIRGSMDPDAAAMRIGLAVLLAVVADKVIRTFVGAAKPRNTTSDTAGKRN